MSGSNGSSSTIGYRYFMSVHMGLARGPLDEIVEIRIGDKMAWPVPGGTQILDGPNPPAAGYATISGTGVTAIAAPTLFGGDKGEGGVQGTLWTWMGEPDQVFDPALKSIMGGDVPDFRGVTTLFFDGMICALNPYPKPWTVRARRLLKGWDGQPWYPEKAGIVLRNGAIRAMNPAHIIYEAATNRDWGRGYPRDRLNEESFRHVADRLYEEAFGLCCRYNRQSGIHEFISDVLNHINAVIFTSKEDGKINLDLIRDDYDPDVLPLFDYDNGLLEVASPAIIAREELINELIVKFKDPIRNEERSVRAQNLASIRTANGAINSSTVEYSMIPTDGLANRVAHRDLRAGNLSGKKYDLVFNREAWRLRPGSVFRISAPDKGINNLILRAGRVEQAGIIDGKIKIVAVPDVFGLPKTAYAASQTSYWTPPDRRARSPLNPILREATWRDIVKNFDRATIAQILPTECYVVSMATKPTELALSHSLFTRTSSETDFVQRDTDTFAPTFMVTAAVSLTATDILFTKTYDITQISLPCAGQINGEIVRIDAITYPNGNVPGRLRVARGCVDTLPQAHPAGSAVLLFDGTLGYDQREYARTEVIQAKLRTNTSTEEQDIADLPIMSLTVDQRQGRPYNAANVRINGASIHAAYVRGQDIVVAWSHRNRISLQDQLLGFFEGDFDPEPNTKYEIRFFNATRTYRTFSDIDARTITYTKAQQDADGLPTGSATFTMELRTIREGVYSRLSSRATCQRG